MRIHVLVGVTALLVSSALASDDIALPHIKVFGTAERKVMPNEMIWRIEVKNKGQVLAEVADKHIEIVKSITSHLKKEFIRPDDIQASRMELGENWEFKNQSRVKDGYHAMTHISFTLHDFGRYRNIWVGLAALGNIHVWDTFYDHSDWNRIKNEIETEALLVARQKASDLAKAIDSHIAEPLLVEELPPFDDFGINDEFGDDLSEDQETSVHPGMITIRARIKASFRLVTHN